MYYDDMLKPSDVSVIIASHRPGMIRTLLNSLKNQQTDLPITIETIIITDYPNGNLQTEFSEYVWLHVPDKSISRKRNCGIKLATAALCAFIDDDCIPSSNWIMQGYQYLQHHPEFAAVEGKTTIEAGEHISTTQTREYRRLEKQGFRTNNLFFRTTNLRTVGAFDERFSVQREDIDLAFTAFKQGYHYAYSVDICVTHSFRSAERWDLLKNCWNRRFDPLLHKKHPDLYRKHIGSPLTPTIKTAYLLMVLLIISCFKRRTTPFILSLTTSFYLIAGVRRTGTLSLSRYFFETIQSVAAPFVTLFALAYGSVRYRTFFLA